MSRRRSIITQYQTPLSGSLTFNIEPRLTLSNSDWENRWSFSVVSIGNYTLDFYLGKTLAGPTPGFFVPPPTLKLGHPTIDWKHFGRHAQYFVDEQVVGQIHDNKELQAAVEQIMKDNPKKNFEPIANSNESSSRLETSGFFRLPAGQSWTFEDQFVISASENDWIATDSILIHDKGLAFKEGDIPETRVENIAVALSAANG